MTAATTLPVSDIKVREGHNVRDEDLELKGSIAELGVLVPLIVEQDGDQVFLVAGHRRLAAAKAAGLEQVPVSYDAGDGNGRRDAVAAAENISRANLDQVQEATAVKRLLDSGMTEKGVQDTLGVSARWVTARKQILDVGEGWHQLIAGGQVSAEELKTLVSVYAVSERLGDELLRWVQRAGHVRIDGWGIVNAATQGKGTFWQVDEYSKVDWPKLKLEPEVEKKRKTLVTVSYGYEEEWRPKFTGADRDRFRAAGVLWEDGKGYNRYAIVTDTELFRQVVTEKIEKAKVPAKKKGAAGIASSGSAAAGDEAKTKAKRKELRDEIATLQARARDLNAKLGVALLKGLSTVQLTKDVAEHLVAGMVVDTRDYYTPQIIALDELAYRGLRYVMPEYSKRVEKGKAKKVVTEYDDRQAAGKKAAKWLKAAKTPGERVGRLLIAEAAAHYAIDAVVPQSQRWVRSGPCETKALERIAKRHLPRGLEALRKRLEKAEKDYADTRRRS